MFSTLGLSWLVVSAVAVLIASLSSQAVSLFTSFWLVIAGLIARPVLQSLPQDTPETIVSALRLFTGIWDLHRFNLSEFSNQLSNMSWQYFLDASVHASLLIVGILSCAIISFRFRDLT